MACYTWSARNVKSTQAGQRTCASKIRCSCDGCFTSRSMDDDSDARTAASGWWVIHATYTGSSSMRCFVTKCFDNDGSLPPSVCRQAIDEAAHTLAAPRAGNPYLEYSLVRSFSEHNIRHNATSVGTCVSERSVGLLAKVRGVWGWRRPWVRCSVR